MWAEIRHREGEDEERKRRKEENAANDRQENAKAMELPVGKSERDEGGEIRRKEDEEGKR